MVCERVACGKKKGSGIEFSGYYLNLRTLEVVAVTKTQILSHVLTPNLEFLSNVFDAPADSDIENWLANLWTKESDIFFKGKMLFIAPFS